MEDSVRPSRAQSLARVLGARYTLSNRELAVIGLVFSGMEEDQVAAELGISMATVKWHRHNVMTKADVNSMTELMSLAKALAHKDTQAEGTPQMLRIEFDSDEDARRVESLVSALGYTVVMSQKETTRGEGPAKLDPVTIHGGALEQLQMQIVELTHRVAQLEAAVERMAKESG